METMSIHRALSELKLIDSKIEKSINALEPVGRQQEGKLVNQESKLEDFEQQAKSKYQSINDLIDRKVKIKSAIVKANAETNVVINEKTMTIAEAINYKTVIEQKKSLIDRLEYRYNNCRSLIENANSQVNQNAIKLAEAALQKDNVKINDGDAIAITEPYIKKNEFNLIDPLNVKELIENLENEVSEFESEIDSVLSEINAITQITV